MPSFSLPHCFLRPQSSSSMLPEVSTSEFALEHSDFLCLLDPQMWHPPRFIYRVPWLITGPIKGASPRREKMQIAQWYSRKDRKLLSFYLSPSLRSPPEIPDATHQLFLWGRYALKVTKMPVSRKNQVGKICSSGLPCHLLKMNVVEDTLFFHSGSPQVSRITLLDFN